MYRNHQFVVVVVVVIVVVVVGGGGGGGGGACAGTVVGSTGSGGAIAGGVVAHTIVINLMFSTVKVDFTYLCLRICVLLPFPSCGLGLESDKTYKIEI